MMPDDRYRWWVVVYSLVIQAISVGVVVYCFALLAVEWLREFDASRAQVMLGISTMQIAFGLLSPLAGAAMDRYSLRNLVLGGCLAFALGLTLLSQATALWQVITIYGVILPFTMCFMGTLVSQTLITRWFTSKRGLAIGISAMGTSIGGIALPLLMGSALLLTDWRTTLLIAAAAAVAIVVPLTLLILKREPQLVLVTGDAKPIPKLTTGSILRTGRFWIPVAALLPLNIAFGAVQFNLGAFASDLNLAHSIGAFIALSSVCMILGKLFFGSLADRIDHRYLYWIAALFMVIGMTALQQEPGLVRFSIGIVSTGLAGGGILPMMAVIMGARFSTDTFGRVMGLVMLAISFASLGPLFAGWVFDATGSYDIAFQVFAALFIPAAIAMAWLPKPIQAGA